MTVQGLFSARANAAAQISAVPRIAIVGRGFSGMMTAIALMKTVRAPFHLQLFDPNSSVSGGQALASVPFLDDPQHPCPGSLGLGRRQ